MEFGIRIDWFSKVDPSSPASRGDPVTRFRLSFLQAVAREHVS